MASSSSELAPSSSLLHVVVALGLMHSNLINLTSSAHNEGRLFIYDFFVLHCGTSLVSLCSKLEFKFRAWVTCSSSVKHTPLHPNHKTLNHTRH